MIIARQRPGCDPALRRRRISATRFTCHGTLEQCDVSPLPCHESH